MLHQVICADKSSLINAALSRPIYYKSSNTVQDIDGCQSNNSHEQLLCWGSFQHVVD